MLTHGSNYLIVSYGDDTTIDGIHISTDFSSHIFRVWCHGLSRRSEFYELKNCLFDDS